MVRLSYARHKGSGSSSGGFTSARMLIQHSSDENRYGIVGKL